MLRRTALLALIASVLPTVVPALAEHAASYRFIVLGYVKDQGGRALPNQDVELVRDKTGFSYLGTTDEKGFFVVIARLGDESAGEQLTLKVADATTPLVARFDPENHRDERGTRVDVQAGRFVERASWFRPTLANFLGAR